MSQVIKGTYENGIITLDKKPDIKQKSKVLVTFLTEEKPENSKRKLGGLEGKVNLPDDFNDPLEDLKDYM